jgi:hypothetical protein
MALIMRFLSDGVEAMPAAVLGPVIGAGIGVVGSAIAGGKANAGAGQAQQILQQQQNNLAPYREAGIPTLQAQGDLLGMNGPDAAAAAMQNYQQSPGYQFQMQQGLRAVDAGAAAKGMARSGATIKGEETFAQGLADSDFQQYYNNLMGISTLGENAAAGGASTANTAGSLAQGAGNTQASIYGNAATGVGNSVNNLLNNSAVQNWLSGSGDPNAGLNNANPTVNYGGTTYGTGGQSFPSFNPTGY